MKIHHVRYFLALCEEGNFTRAAKRCGVSQPSLSNAIRGLETEFGGKLFHRGPTTFNISELGQAVRPYLVNIERYARDASIEAARFKENGIQDECCDYIHLSAFRRGAIEGA